MKIRNTLLSCVLLVVLLPLPGRASLAAHPAPDGIESDEWVNLIGEAPQLEHLKGRAVLLHFFGPQRNRGGRGGRGGGGDDEGGLPQAYFSLVRKFHYEHQGKGLVVLGFCDESKAKLAEYQAAYDIPYPVAIRGSARATFGVTGPNELILLDRKGGIFWRGPNNGLWDGKLLKGSKGGKRLGEKGLVALHAAHLFGKGVKKAVGQCATGDLAKALKGIETLLANPRTTEVVRGESEALQEAIAAHVTRLMEQIEACLGAREVLMAVQALETLVRELKKHELGTAPTARLAAVHADEALQEELVAAETYAGLLASYFKRGLRNNLKRLEKLIEEHPDTLAAQKARNLIAGR